VEKQHSKKTQHDTKNVHALVNMCIKYVEGIKIGDGLEPIQYYDRKLKFLFGFWTD